MRTKKQFFAFFAITIAAVLALGNLSFASAQTDGTAIKISPVLFDDLTANSGEQLSGLISVSNPGNDNLSLYPEAQNFLPKEGSEEGIPETTMEDTPYALKDWVTFNVTKVDLAPGQKEDVKFFINIPVDASPGGHYGTLVFSTKAAEGTPESTQLKVESGVGALVLLRVNGDVVESGSTLDFTNSGVVGSPGEPMVEFTLRFENTGNTHVKPEGTITITNWLGSEVAQVALEGENVLPGSTRQMVTPWKPEGSLYGKYIATLQGTYGESNQAFTATTSFGDYHLITILIIVIIILLIILFIKMSSKSYKDELSKEIKEEMKE
ncbi:hypothetical protein KJ855_03265 [Patescibacteria group bacterium]|nr:hypothetical protein [Patescibacteria group bacterium]